MKISKTMKTALVAAMVTIGSLGAMSFTAVKAGVCVKQVVTLNDGRSITAYYVQDGTSYALYSTADLNQYKPSDLKRITDNKFQVSAGYEGKCYYRAESLQEAIDMANTLFQQYKPML